MLVCGCHLTVLHGLYKQPGYRGRSLIHSFNQRTSVECLLCELAYALCYWCIVSAQLMLDFTFIQGSR